MNPASRSSNGGNGNGNGAGGFDDFDDFIRDRESEFGEPEAEGFDPYADFRAGHGGSTRPGIDRGLVEAIVRILDGLGGVAGEALSPDLRRQLEKTLRDLLVVLRDIINAMIERIDGRRDDDFEIEEIPID
ncbi:MAG: hypothetical protein QM648_02835 [Solirubrobacterales bacterium]